MTQVINAWNLGQRLGISDSDAQILYFAGSIILTIALVFVTAYYAYQNKRMVEEIRKQNRPYVFIAAKRDGEDPLTAKQMTRRLVLYNTGNRVARDIKLSIICDAFIWQYEFGEGRTPEDIAVSFVRHPVSMEPVCRDGLPSLAPGEEEEIGFVPKTAHKEDKDWGEQVLRYVVSYFDGAGVKYEEELTARYFA